MKKVLTFLICICFFINISKVVSQKRDTTKSKLDRYVDSVKRVYDDHLLKIKKGHDDYLKKIDKEYSDFLQKQWDKYNAFEGLKKEPKPKPSQQPVFVKKERIEPIQNIPIKKIEPSQENYPDLLPEIPISINPAPEPEKFEKLTSKIDYYGKKLDFIYDKNMFIKTSEHLNEKMIGNYWESMSKTNYYELITQLMDYKQEMNLNDWGYLMMVKKFTRQVFSNNDNDGNLMLWFLMNQSKYKIRIGNSDNKLLILFPSNENIYNLNYFKFQNISYPYYVMDKKVEYLNTYKKDYPGADKIIDMNFDKPMKIADGISDRRIDFTDNSDHTYSLNFKYNNNSIEFYKEYPSCDLKIYFDGFPSSIFRESIEENLLPLVKGKTDVEATNLLLRFVQYSFKYQKDDEQFGKEKFDFPEEILYYPYSDCDDRAIFFSFLVKDLLHLDVVGLEYSTHVATAIKFNTVASGGLYTFKGNDYFVCDPTYTNGMVGDEMENYIGKEVKIIELRNYEAITDNSNNIWEQLNKDGIYKGDIRQNIEYDGDGNIYVTGYFNGEINIDGNKLISDHNTNDIIIAKLDRKGKVLWIKHADGSGNDIALNIAFSKNKDLYVSGVYNNDLRVDGKEISTKNNEIFLAKLDRDGKVEWLRGCKTDSMNLSNNNIFISKFNKKGEQLQTNIYNDDKYFKNFGISFDGDGNIYFTGSYNSTTSLSFKPIYYADMAELDIPSKLKTECDILIKNKYNKSIAGLFAAINLILDKSIVLQGKAVQKALDNFNPGFKQKCPNIYNNLGKIEFVKNEQGIICIRTFNQQDILFDKMVIKNNSKLKIRRLESGDAQIEIFSGAQVFGEIPFIKTKIFENLNSISLSKITGDLIFNYAAKKETKKNLKRDILD